MRKETLAKICCPFDKETPELTIITRDTEDRILEGFLHCPACKRVYPFVKGIPIMNPDEYREHSLEKPLIEAWQTYLKGNRYEQFRLVSAE